MATPDFIRNMFNESPSFRKMNALILDAVGLDIFQLAEYQQAYGDFATNMLIGARLMQMTKNNDVFKNAIAEVAQDKEFIDSLPAALRQQVYEAVGTGHYDA